MQRKQIIDPDGHIICRKCDNIYPRNNEYFAKNCTTKYRLMTICKTCDNKRRSEKDKLKAYHNLPRRCKTCAAFFYASKGHINKCKRKNPDTNVGLYCSIKCAIENGACLGMRGKSWNGRRRGSNNPTAILNEGKVMEIRRFLKQGMHYLEAAKLFGVARSTISSIRAYRSWKHVE